MIAFDSLDDLLSAPPLDLGSTDWIEIGEKELSDFAAATGGPVSPYLAVSLTNRFLPDLLQVPAASSGVNYGADGISLGDPLRAGDRACARARLVGAVGVAGGVQTAVEISIEVEGGRATACTVVSLSRWLA